METYETIKVSKKNQHFQPVPAAISRHSVGVNTKYFNYVRFDDTIERVLTGKSRAKLERDIASDTRRHRESILT